MASLPLPVAPAPSQEMETGPVPTRNSQDVRKQPFEMAAAAAAVKRVMHPGLRTGDVNNKQNTKFETERLQHLEKKSEN